MKHKRLAVVLGIVLALALGMALAVPAQEKKPAVCFDKKLCAEKLRYGSEAFARGAYGEAKAFFRQAVQADPLSATAWAYYDLSVMYDVADQVKKAGQVKVSGAPLPSSVPPAPAASAPAPAKAPAAAPPSKDATPAAIPAIKPDEGC